MLNKTIAGAHNGTGWWLAQRLSSVVMLLVGCALLAAYWFTAPFDYAAWHAAMQNTSINLLVWLLIASLCLHAWIGLRDVLMDYVKPIAVRLALVVLVTLVLLLCTTWATLILWSAHGLGKS